MTDPQEPDAFSGLQVVPKFVGSYFVEPAKFQLLDLDPDVRFVFRRHDRHAFLICLSGLEPFFPRFSFVQMQLAGGFLHEKSRHWFCNGFSIIRNLED